MTVDSKGTLAPALAMNAHTWNGGVTSIIPKFYTRWRRVVIFMLWLLFPCSKSFWCSSNWRMGGPQNQSRYFGEHKTPHLLAHGIVTLLIELSQLLTAAVDWIHVLIVDGLV